MNVSVIIPIYNCSDYLTQAVLSAVHLPEVRQIVLIDDGSTDSSLSLCRELSEKYETVSCLTHDENANRGRSVSRNLGLKKSSENWIAFLDADDYYLPNRFDHFSATKSQNHDGFYEPIRSEYTRTEYTQIFPELITTINKDISPNELLDYMIQNSQEKISLLGLTVPRELLCQMGGFDESLITGEDTDLIWRLAHTKRLKGTSSKYPVAIRRVHGRNSYFDQDLVDKGRYLFYKKWTRIMDTMILDTSSRKVLIRKYLNYVPVVKKYHKMPIMPYILKMYFYGLYKLRINLR